MCVHLGPNKWSCSNYDAVLSSPSLHPSLLASSPGPSPPKERPGTDCLRMREIFCYIFCKKLHALPCPYMEDNTNQERRAFFELVSSDDSTAEPRWDTTYRMWQYHFSKCTALHWLQKGNKSIYQKALLVATEYFISLRTWFIAPLP